MITRLVKTDDVPEPILESRDDGISLEVWPKGQDSYEVTVCCEYPRAKWWQWWRSDLPLPYGKQKAVLDALQFAQSWLCRKEARKKHVLPSYMELIVTFTESD